MKVLRVWNDMRVNTVIDELNRIFIFGWTNWIGWIEPIFITSYSLWLYITRVFIWRWLSNKFYQL